jgi:hypothetical protein
MALRERGHEILAEKHSNGWQYILRDPKKQRERRRARQSKDSPHGQRGANRQ